MRLPHCHYVLATGLLWGLSTSPLRAETINTLEQQGLTEGVSLVESDSPTNFYVRVPADIALSSGHIRLHLNLAPGLGPNSVLQIFVNGLPRRQMAIGDLSDTTTNQTIDIALESRDLENRYIAIRAIAVFLTHGGTPVRGFVRVLPDSGFVFDDTKGDVRSIRGFLSLLAPTVRVRLPKDKITVDDFRSIVAVSSYLQYQGRRIEWVAGDADPQVTADIVLGTDDNDAPPASGARDIHLVTARTTSPAHLVIALGTPQTLLFSPWTDLLAGDSYGSSTTTPRSTPLNSILIPLAQLGVTSDAAPLTTRASWSFALPPEQIHQMAPSHIHLNMVVPPGNSGNPMLLHVFDNGELRNVTALPARGGAVSVDLPLVETGNSASENIRIDLLRQDPSGNNIALTPSYAQILPSSTITVTPLSASADTLDNIGRSFGAATSLYIPAAALLHPDMWMAALAGIVNTLHLNAYNLKIHADESVPDANDSFIWLRNAVPTGFTAPVVFDRGRVRVVESDGTILLDAPPMPDIELAAILRKGSQRGLWIKPTSDGPALRPIGFDKAAGDIVFMDRHGQITALDTRIIAAAKNAAPVIAYPDSKTWLDKIQNARLWILGCGLLALTLIFLAIIDKLKAQRQTTNDS